MKTKLSFIALPLYGGVCACLALTFVLASCSGEGPTNSTTSSSSNVTHPSSAVNVPGVIEITDFGIVDYSDQGFVVIAGKVTATRDVPVAKLRFKASNTSWISFRDAPVTGDIMISGERQINLENETEIDFRNPINMPCGTPITVSLEAWNTEGTSASTAAVSFTRPDRYCAALSSSSEVSSSSEAVWKFGQSTSGTVNKNQPVTIGSGTFELKEGPEGSGLTDGAPEVEITGGKIRVPLLTSTGCRIDFDPNSGNSYPSNENCLGSKEPTASKLSEANNGAGAQSFEYYLVYVGGSKYLLQFQKGDGVLFSGWPKKFTYWIATESP